MFDSDNWSGSSHIHDQTSSIGVCFSVDTGFFCIILGRKSGVMKCGGKLVGVVRDLRRNE